MKDKVGGLGGPPFPLVLGFHHDHRDDPFFRLVCTIRSVADKPGVPAFSQPDLGGAGFPSNDRARHLVVCSGMCVTRFIGIR